MAYCPFKLETLVGSVTKTFLNCHRVPETPNTEYIPAWLKVAKFELSWRYYRNPQTLYTTDITARKYHGCLYRAMSA
jgi:hypothetical protein